MEFVIHRNDLVRELQTITGVVEKRATLPILANLLLETTSDAIKVGASDLEVTIRGQAKATVVKEGSVTLPAAKLHEIARSLPESEVQFKLLDRHQMSIQCERTKYRISGQPRDEFPQFPELEDSGEIKLPGQVLRGMIDRVAFAITTEDPRYSLNGALLLIEKKKITLVATDGHRLAYISREAEVEPAAGDALKVIVPRKALAELSKLAAELDDEADIGFGKGGNHIFFRVGTGHLLTSTILEGNFPRYENVMPGQTEISVLLPTGGFGSAVRRVSLLAADRFGRAVRVKLTNGTLELESETEMGKAEETLSVDYDGPELQIGFNSRYLLDFTSAVGTDSVHLDLSAAGAEGAVGDKPGQFRPEPADGLDYRYIVMPMHL